MSDVLAELEAASPAELDALVRSTGVRALLARAGDRRPEVRALLCDRRLADLSADARAALAWALQTGGDADQQATVRLLLETRGSELTRLKLAIDEWLPGLVWADIDDSQRRHTVLSHFALEGAPSGAVRLLHDLEDLPAGRRLPCTLERVLQYQALYPEHAFVVAGGDAAFAAAIRQRAPAAVRDVLVAPRSGLAVALRAFELQAIDKPALLRVARAAQEQFRTRTFATDAERAARRAELLEELEAVRRG